jgi:hypothetical protein
LAFAWLEFWFARDLQAHLGYACWENFQTAINRAVESCEATGHVASDHFRGVTKMVDLGSGSKREVDDFMLTDEHVKNNESVRDMLGQRGIRPEKLAAEEDLKKLELRVKSEEKKLAKNTQKLPPHNDENK